MDMAALDSLSEPELRQYVEFLLWHYRVVDAFWFIYASERFDQATAERLNEQVWAKAGGMGAKDLVRRFGIGEGAGWFVKTLRLFPGPSWLGTRSGMSRSDHHGAVLPHPGGARSAVSANMCKGCRGNSEFCPGHRPCIS